jgi:hypothetical protein
VVGQAAEKAAPDLRDRLFDEDRYVREKAAPSLGP